MSSPILSICISSSISRVVVRSCIYCIAVRSADIFIFLGSFTETFITAEVYYPAKFTPGYFPGYRSGRRCPEKPRRLSAAPGPPPTFCRPVPSGTSWQYIPHPGAKMHSCASPGLRCRITWSNFAGYGYHYHHYYYQKLPLPSGRLQACLDKPPLRILISYYSLLIT